MKLKLIDLLVKIANNEEVPDYVEYRNWNNNTFDTMCVCTDNIIDKLNKKEIYLNDEIVIVEEKSEPAKPKKVAIGFDNIQENDLGWTYIEEGSCQYYVPVALLNRLTSLADAVNYLLEKEGE
jgi:hypothetical protein